MMGHPLCSQTVTLYRPTPTGVERQVVTGCFYSWRQEWEDGILQTRFVLILPTDPGIGLGHRVYAGVGPEQVSWETFLPSNTPGLGQVAYVQPYYLAGRLHHIEAGRK